MSVVVYGASGWTGYHVARELMGYGAPVALAGRSRDRLTAVNTRLEERAAIRVAELRDPRALAAALVGARVLVNCAGPLRDSGPPLLKAAMRAGVHYLDVSGEEQHVRAIYAMDRQVAAAGITACPGFAGKGALGDLGAAVAAEPLRAEGIEHVAIAYAHGLGGARNPSPASIVSLALEGFTRPADQVGPAGPIQRPFPFPPPFRRGTALQVQAAENVSVPRHVSTPSVSGFISFEPGHAVLNQLWVELTRAAFPLLPALRSTLVSDWGRWHLNLYLPTPEAEHDRDTFAVSIEVTGPRTLRRLGIAMHDAYAGSAAIAAVGTVRLLTSEHLRPGVLSPAQLCAAAPTLEGLQRQGVIRLFQPADSGHQGWS